MKALLLSLMVATSSASPDMMLLSDYEKKMFRNFARAVAAAEHYKAGLRACATDNEQLREALQVSENLKEIQIKEVTAWWTPWVIAGGVVGGIVLGSWASTQFAK